MGIQHAFRQLCYSVVLHSGLRNWRLAHQLRSSVAAFVGDRDLRAAQARLLSDPSVSDKEKLLLQQISLTVHRNDEMYVPFDARHYLSAGLSALRCIERAVPTPNGSRPVKSILDLPCGHGRVLRFLRARFPDAEITASELNADALAFCKNNFRVNTAVSKTDFSQLSVPGRFDLIWCGSLLTHIDESSAAGLLKFFHEKLTPGGRCVFTTHGKSVADTIRNTRNVYGLGEHARRELLAQFDACGYGYGDYASTPGFGVSVATPERMLSVAHSVGSWKNVTHIERGWDNHQDVFIAELA